MIEAAYSRFFYIRKKDYTLKNACKFGAFQVYRYFCIKNDT